MSAPPPREHAHWWDADPALRDRNLLIEESIEDLIAHEERRAPERRVLNGHTASIKAWAQAIGLIGIPGVIAFWLVWVVSTEIPRMSRQQDTIISEQRQASERDAQLIELFNTLIRVSQRACSNSARDENARQRCFDR